MWWFAAAFAQDEVCAGSWTASDWHDALDGVDAALSELDGDLAEAIVADVVDGARCTGERVPREELARLARQASVLGFFASDTAELQSWAPLARALSGPGPWPGVAVPARFYTMLAEVPEPERVTLEDRGFVLPRGAGVLVDGELVLVPAATASATHFVQALDRKERPLWTGFVVGPDLPLLGEPVTLEAPDWYEAPAPVEAVAPAAPEGEGELEVRFGGGTEGCPWEGQPSEVRARNRRITVDGADWPLADAEDLSAFRGVLRSCGELRALRRLARWQALLGAPFSGARKERDRLVQALLTPEPKRRRARGPATP